MKYAGYPSWQFQCDRAGVYEVNVLYAAGEASGDGRFEVAAAGARTPAEANVGGATVAQISAGGLFDLPADAESIEASVEPTGAANRFTHHQVGRIHLPAGRCLLAVRARKMPKDAPLMNLKQVELKPVEGQMHEKVQSLPIEHGDLAVEFRDGSESPRVLSGVQSLVNTKAAPGFDAFDPDTPGASAGLNFEHIIAGHDSPHNAFTPRRGYYPMFKLPDGRSVELVRKAEDSPWKVASTLRCTVTAPHYIDFEFTCSPQDKHLFWPRNHAILFFANYMNDVEDVSLHFLGAPKEGAPEQWIAADAPDEHEDWNQGGTYRHAKAEPLKTNADLGFALNSWSYDYPRFTKPFYYGRAANGMVYILMFDRGWTERDEMRFSLFKFKLGQFPRPAWDFQYVIRGIETAGQYGFRGRAVWKKFVSPEDCLAEYEKWAGAIESGK